MLADLARRDDVIAFDLFGDLDLRAAPCRHAPQPDRARRRRRGGGAGRASSTARASRTTPSWSSAWPSGTRCWATRAATLRAVRDPVRLGAALGDLPYPRTTVAAPSAGRWLRKPLRGGGGTRVREWRGGAVRAGTFLQERIDGVPCSAAAVGDGRDAVVLGLTEQLVGERAFGVRGHRWCGNLVPPRVPVPRDQAQAICSRVAAAFGLRGLFGVDFVWDGERAWTVEVNPRPTASLEAIEAAYGVRVFDAPARSWIARARAGAAGKAVLFATEDVVVGDSERWLERGVRDVPHPGERIAQGRPICTVVATAATPEDALARLEEQAARLRAELRVEVAAGG